MADGSFVLQKYNIVEKLAAGGMAEIYLAKRKENHFQNKFYAVKRILPTLADRPEYLVYLKDEAKALSLLQHQNIIGFHDFFFENNQFYLVMEYISGKTLREMFLDFEKKKQLLSVEYLLYIVMEVAAGLDYAHNSFDYVLDKSLNLVHRDLNPQNIMISYEGQIKIIDFGISKFDIRDDFTKTGMLKGKFGYMSPEQVEGLEIDARTDVFALGILCWELLTNKRLFDGEDDFEKFNKIKNHKMVSVSEHNSVLSKDLDIIVMKALEPKAADRFQTAADFRHAISLYIARNFPDFRPEKFRRLIGQIYADELKKTVEKLCLHFQKSAQQEEESTNTTREYYLKQAQQERNLSPQTQNTQSSAPKISLPQSFELNINKARLKLEVPTYEETQVETQPALDLEPVVDISKKKKTKVPKHTQLEPERYKVQVDRIKVSSFHAWINSYGPHVKATVYIASLSGMAWGALVVYEQGYFHLLLNVIYHLLK